MVYLRSFLMHAAQMHRGEVPEFMAQPPLLPTRDLQLDRDEEALSPVEQAITAALRATD